MSEELSPAAVMDGVLGYVKTAALIAAIRLDVFTAIGEGARTATAIAQRIGAAERGVRVLCDYLTAQMLLTKQEDDYGLSPTAAVFLDRRSPAAMGAIEGFLASPEMLNLLLTAPGDCVRNGGSPGLANVAPDNPVWVKFARAMVPFAAPLASAPVDWMAAHGVSPRRVLDIAASHGLYGIEVARRFPNAEVTALDWGAVLEVGRENAEAVGVTERFRWIAGSAFDVDLGGPYDVVLMPNFLHHFDEAGCVALLGRVRHELTAGGYVLAPDIVPEEDRTSPAFAAMFAFLMLATTPAGTAYTRTDFERIFAAAGFPSLEFAPLGPNGRTLVIASL
jgi:2-polyprenyl-3-methyl-5-hydroxy-6-metoxy-1,4-benzoquinol methylase